MTILKRVSLERSGVFLGKKYMDNDRQSKRDSAKRKDRAAYSSKHVRLWSALCATKTATASSLSVDTPSAKDVSKSGP